MRGFPPERKERSMFWQIPGQRKFHGRLLLATLCLAFLWVLKTHLPLQTVGIVRPAEGSWRNAAAVDAVDVESDDDGVAEDAIIRPFNPNKYDDIDEGKSQSRQRRPGYDDDSDDVPDRGSPPSHIRHLYREIFSLSTHDGSFAPIQWGEEQAYNPNLLPHPTKKDTWIIVAQHEQSAVKDLLVSEEFAIEATLRNGVLSGSQEPVVMPIAPSLPGTCTGKFTYFNFRHGPRDARVFYGPRVPYILYGSQSQYTCIGIWAADVRPLLDAFDDEDDSNDEADGQGAGLFAEATEIRRPKPWNGMEKNFFLFWDKHGNTFAHHDLYPKRVFAMVNEDGTVGEDLASKASDNFCMSRYMPRIAPTDESIHQATNSLSITLCNRGECEPDDSNTFIMHVFHHKSYWDYHGVYEPYALLFRRYAPFEMHAIAQRPYWIHGRSVLSNETQSLGYKDDPGNIPKNHTEMFYVTSISWKDQKQKYHGYLDDSMWLGFGIEDTRAGAIDVEAGTLMRDLAFC